VDAGLTTQEWHKVVVGKDGQRECVSVQDAVFRELYSEKRVVLEERRARVDNAPLGKFLEGFHQRAYSNNYG